MEKDSSIEQYFIKNGPNRDNKISSIGKNNKYHNMAKEWAENYLGK